MAVRDLVRTVVAGEEVIGVLIPSTVTDLVSQRLQLVHVILRRRFPPKRSVRFTKIPYWDWIVKIVQIKFKLSDSRRKTTYYAEIGFFKELVVSWLPQSQFSTTLRKYTVSFSFLNFFFRWRYLIFYHYLNLKYTMYTHKCTFILVQNYWLDSTWGESMV